MSATNIFFLSCLLLVVLGTSACGIKPSSLEPPPGAEEIPFPQTYPTPEAAR